eukprot:PhF_6_TR44139/c1_g1_i4/m.67473
MFQMFGIPMERSSGVGGLWSHLLSNLEGCGHIFCRMCVKPLTTCPMCRKAIKATKAPNRTLLELANNLGARASIATTGPPMCPSHPCLPVDKFCRKCVREGCGICMMGTCHSKHPAEILDI